MSQDAAQNILEGRPVFFLTSKPPFPPDDGQKIPVANYHNAILSFGAVPQVIIVKKQPNRSLTSKLSALVQRLNPFSGFYASEVLDSSDAAKIIAAPRPIVFVTPARLLGQAASLKTQNPDLQIVLLLNDAKWPMYFEALQYGLGLRAGGGRVDLLKGLLTPITYLKELTAYKAADVVVVQTERERSKLGWLDAKSVAAMNAIARPSAVWNGNKSTVLSMQINFTNRRTEKWRPFVETVWPEIYKSRPDLTLELFGPGQMPPPEWVRIADGVRYIGRVDDLDTYLANSRMLLMPLEHSTGVSNMVLHGLAMDMPMMISATAKDGVAELLAGRAAVFVANSNAKSAQLILKGLDLDHTPAPTPMGNWSDNLSHIIEKVLD